MYLHTLMLQSRITGIEAEIRKTALMLAQILDRRSIVALAWGENDSEVYDLDEWTLTLVDLLDELEDDYNHYRELLASVQIEMAAA